MIVNHNMMVMIRILNIIDNHMLLTYFQWGKQDIHDLGIQAPTEDFILFAINLISLTSTPFRCSNTNIRTICAIYLT